MERRPKQNKRRIILSDETFQSMRSNLQAAYQEVDATLKTLMQLNDGKSDPTNQIEKQQILKDLNRIDKIPKMLRKVEQAMWSIKRIENDPNPTRSVTIKDSILSARLREEELGKYPKGLQPLVTMRFQLGVMIKRVDRFEELNVQDPPGPVA